MTVTRRFRPPTIVFDMDGTLVDVSSIKHLAEGGFKNNNFDDFHQASITCPPIPWVLEHAQEAAKQKYRVIQLTARQEKYRSSTSQWLTEHGVPSDAIYMRSNGDFRPDYDVKKDLLTHLFQTYNIVKAFDDNPSIVRLWGEYQIPCIVVPGWNNG